MGEDDAKRDALPGVTSCLLGGYSTDARKRRAPPSRWGPSLFLIAPGGAGPVGCLPNPAHRFCDRSSLLTLGTGVPEGPRLRPGALCYALATKISRISYRNFSHDR